MQHLYEGLRQGKRQHWSQYIGQIFYQNARPIRRNHNFHVFGTLNNFKLAFMGHKFRSYHSHFVPLLPYHRCGNSMFDFKSVSNKAVYFDRPIRSLLWGTPGCHRLRFGGVNARDHRSQIHVYYHDNCRNIFYCFHPRNYHSAPVELVEGWTSRGGSSDDVGRRYISQISGLHDDRNWGYRRSKREAFNQTHVSISKPLILTTI